MMSVQEIKNDLDIQREYDIEMGITEPTHGAKEEKVYAIPPQLASAMENANKQNNAQKKNNDTELLCMFTGGIICIIGVIIGVIIGAWYSFKEASIATNKGDNVAFAWWILLGVSLICGISGQNNKSKNK
jgi:hypothetical protein